MKDFSYFVDKKSVKKQAPDKHTALATARDSFERLNMAKSIAATQKPKYALENAYEAIRELIDAILFTEGFKSFSHEASVAYLIKLGFSFSEAMQVDKLRKQRNSIKYYGEGATKEEAQSALKVAEEIMNKLVKKKSEFSGLI